MAAAPSGLTQRRKAKADTADSQAEEDAPEKDLFSDTDDAPDSDKQLRLTLLEEVVLLGLKDRQGYLSWWNDNISYVLRGCILIELSLRGRIDFAKDSRRRPISDRIVEVVDKTPTGDVLLDEALKLITTDQENIVNWIDLLSGETWNFMKMGFQLKQVRERIQKGLVDKGVLRTEKQNFLLFDMATHPISNMEVRDDLVRRAIDVLLRRGPAPDRRTIAMVCAAYAANVIENALANLNPSQRDAAFTRVDELLAEYAKYTDKNARTNTEIMAGVFQVYSKMDSLL